MLAFLHDLSNAKYEMLNQHAIHTAEYFMAYSWPKISGGKKRCSYSPQVPEKLKNKS